MLNDTFLAKLKNTIVKIVIKSFSVYKAESNAERLQDILLFMNNFLGISAGKSWKGRRT